MNRRLYKYLLFAYAISSSIFLGGLIGFLVINPILQIVLEKRGYYELRWAYLAVVLSIAAFMYINWKRYVGHLRKKNLL